MKAHKVKKEPRYNNRIQCKICKKWFKIINWSHLLQIHGLTTTDYKKGYGVDFLFSDQNRKMISDRFTKKPTKDIFKPLTRAEVICGIQYYAQQKSPLTHTWLKKRDPKLLTQVYSIFGGWRTGLEAAHVEPKRIQHWTKDRIISEIHKRLSKNLMLNTSTVLKDDKKLYYEARLSFGSWRKAIEGSDIEYNQIRKNKEKYTREMVLQYLRAWINRNGPLNTKRLVNSDHSLYYAVLKCYGTLEKAAQTLKLPYYRLQKKWSQDHIMEEIKKRASRGHSLRLTNVEKEDHPLYKAALSYFGSWRNAIKACGFDYNKIKFDRLYKREKTARDLRAWVTKYGPLNAKDLQINHSALYQATRRFFSSIEEAANILGLPYYKRCQYWSKGKILRKIKHRAARGRLLNVSSISKEDPPLYDAGRRYFGTWENALKACGFDYDKIRIKKVRTKETLDRDLRAWIKEHGPLNTRDLQNIDYAIYDATCKIFGSVEKASHTLNLPFFRRHQCWSKDRIIKEIKRRNTEGLFLNLKLVQKDDNRLFEAAYRHFDSWRNAVKASGFDYSRIIGGKNLIRRNKND